MHAIYFYPRPPRGGRRGAAHPWGSAWYFYPRPPRGGRRPAGHGMRQPVQISIHALREEGDFEALRPFRLERDFYPRPPRGGRLVRDGPMLFCRKFLSTPSARRATPALQSIWNTLRFLSTPSARRATAKTETKSLFSNKLYNILHEFRRALIYNGSKNYPNHAK